MPIAIASEKSSASICGRESATLIAKIETVRTPATATSSREKPRSPTWNASRFSFRRVRDGPTGEDRAPGGRSAPERSGRIAFAGHRRSTSGARVVRWSWLST